MGGIRVGICSWTDRTLLKSGFYPASASNPAGRLAYYASRFNVVEIDSTYYALADSLSAFRWIGGTPAEFLFGLKSYGIFTFHRVKFGSLPQWLKAELGGGPPDALVSRNDLSHKQRVRLYEEFLRPIEILRSSGKLAYLLFQFPPGWVFSAEALSYIRRIREMSGPMPLALEVRNKSWLDGGNREKFLDTLRDQNIAYVAVDEPALSWTVPRDWPVTAEWGTVARFHGRNVAGWRNPKATVHERFDYAYKREELAEWTGKISELFSRFESWQEIFVMLNNCVSDKAARSAWLLMEMLGMGEYPLGLQQELDF
jgi:uncharacterized protein YecE (DUF72 family)